MSIAVTVDELGATMAGFGFAYLLTVGDDGRPHVTAVSPTWADGRVRVGDLGRRTRANLAARPEVTLVWPPTEPDGFSLIVDGTGVLDDGGPGDGGDGADMVAVAASRAVLHRPAPAAEPAPGACEADCVEITLPAP